MQTINQAGDPLADYDSRVRRWQQTGREDGFEDDATARLPSRVMVDALGPHRELGVVGVGRSGRFGKVTETDIGYFH